MILTQFEGVTLTLTTLKISYLEQLNSKFFCLAYRDIGTLLVAELSIRFSRFKIDHLIKVIGINLEFG
ncbi:hypothetical protein F9Y84_10060 [Pseudoalteromonas peptidolytica]|nr:hypothetical protein [Pseudoalteromonas peptidolytica]